MSKSKTFTMSINGVRWRYKLVSPERFIAEHGEIAAAITDPNTNSVHFVDSDMDTIFHELFHTYCRSLHVESSNISWRDFEEIIAGMLGAKVFHMIYQAKRIYVNLNGEEYERPSQRRKKVRSGKSPSGPDSKGASAEDSGSS